jgi:hypothetical protein
MTQPQTKLGVWEILNRFKELCHHKGWETSSYEDIVKIDNEYHNLIGARTIHPSTFRRIISNKRIAVPDGASYAVIDVSYTAWIFQQPPSPELVEALQRNAELAKKTALYDLSSIQDGKPLCRRINGTASRVFTEFEKFLKQTYEVEVRPLYKPKIFEPKTFKSKLSKASAG